MQLHAGCCSLAGKLRKGISFFRVTLKPTRALTAMYEQGLQESHAPKHVETTNRKTQSHFKLEVPQRHLCQGADVVQFAQTDTQRLRNHKDGELYYFCKDAFNIPHENRTMVEGPG